MVVYSPGFCNWISHQSNWRALSDDLAQCYAVCQIIDPFVEVEIIGLPVDCCKEQTRVVDDNGELNEKFSLCVHAIKPLPLLLSMKGINMLEVLFPPTLTLCLLPEN